MTAYSAHMREYQATGMQPCKTIYMMTLSLLQQKRKNV